MSVSKSGSLGLIDAVLYGPAVFAHFSSAPVKTDRAVRIQKTNQVQSFTMKVYAWLIDLIHRRKNCPTGMIPGWVQKVTEHRGTIQYANADVLCKAIQRKKSLAPDIRIIRVSSPLNQAYDRCI